MDDTTRPVVVGIDGIHDAPLWFAVDEALRCGVCLRVVHCAALPLEPVEFHVSRASLRTMLARSYELMDRTRRALEKDAGALDVDYLLSDRPPVQLLLEESEEARLLVVGIDDIAWYNRLLGMAVAGHVVQGAHCPVFTVPEQRGDRARRAGVVVALDGNSAARPLLRLAFEEAQGRGCDLHAFRDVPDDLKPSVIESARAALGEVLAGWREEYPDVQVVQEVVAGPLSEVCHTATRNAQLVLIGRTRQHGPGRPFAADLLRRAECPVGVVPLDACHE